MLEKENFLIICFLYLFIIIGKKKKFDQVIELSCVTMVKAFLKKKEKKKKTFIYVLDIYTITLVIFLYQPILFLTSNEILQFLT